MEAALSRLYACIMMFFHLCARRYNRSSWGRLWSSLKDSFKLKYIDLIADIELCSTLVESLANAGARIEIWNIHVFTEAGHAKLAEIDAKMDRASCAQMEKLENMDKSVSRMCNGQATIIDGQIRLLDGQMKLDRIDTNVVELFNSQGRLVDGQMQLFKGQTRLEARMTQIYQIVTSSQSTFNLTYRAVYRVEFHHILEFFTPKTLDPTQTCIEQCTTRKHATWLGQQRAWVDPRPLCWCTYTEASN
jgi:hypothetical protein